MKQSNADLVRQYVNTRISGMVQSYSKPMIDATLAKLRRGIRKAPGSLPELWDITLEGLPESLLSKNDRPSYGEWAVYSALTLFALHQQGKDIKNQCMHESNVSLGQAMRQLINRNLEREDAIKRRFVTAVTAESYEELTWHLRGLIQLLRTDEIKLDYSRLAKDLFHFQIPNYRDGIRLQWGRDFYRYSSDQQSDSNPKN